VTQELTQKQLDRQDAVDNECHDLLNSLGSKTSADSVPWDIELISIVREAVQEVVVDKLHLMTEMEFYPYIEC